MDNQFVDQYKQQKFLDNTSKSGKRCKELQKKFVTLKDKEVYAIIQRKLHTIYYNLNFTGNTKLYLYY